MKLFKSTILAMLGMAVALTSCSDDDKYEPGNTQAGAYFVDASQTAYINDETSVFEVEVFRTPQGGNEYTVVAEDPSGLFSIPTTVTFAGSELSTKIVISCDPSKFEYNDATEIKLSVGDPISYASNTTVVEVVKGYPRISEPFDTKRGTYIFAGYYSGYQEDVPVFKAYLPTTPDKDVNIVIGSLEDDEPLYPGIELIVNIPDMSARDANGNIPVNVPSQYYTDNATYGRVCVADEYTWYTVYIPSIGKRVKDEVIEEAKGKSFFDPESGLFTLNVTYYVPDYDDGISRFGTTNEYFQLDGYPVYDVQIEYNGLFINRNEDKEARATVTCGADVSKVRTYMVEGTDIDAAMEAIFANAEGVTIYNGQDEFQATFPITKGGTYTIVAISYDETGEAQQLGYDTFDIVLGESGGESEDGDWVDFGTVDYMDSWVVFAYTSDYIDFAYSVPVQKSTSNPSLYRLIQPYGAECPVYEMNKYPADRNIIFYADAATGNVCVERQLCGFGNSTTKGEMAINSLEGYYMAEKGWSMESTIATLKANDYETSYLEDGLITIPDALFGSAGLGGNGYQWQTEAGETAPTYIILPDASDNVRARVKAQVVAKPALGGVVAKAKQKKVANLTLSPRSKRVHPKKHLMLRNSLK